MGPHDCVLYFYHFIQVEDIYSRSPWLPVKINHINDCRDCFSKQEQHPGHLPTVSVVVVAPTMFVHCLWFHFSETKKHITVEFQWLEHPWGYKYMIERGVVGASECESKS